MNRDELLLEIIEKVHNQVEKLDAKLDDVQSEQIRHGEILKINTEDLKEHMARTEASEKRLVVLERYLMFASFTIQVVCAVGAVTLFIVQVAPFIGSLF